MSRFHSYLNSASEILSHYQGKEPFASFLKKYFAVNKKYGSTDRKQVSHLCYCYFRLGKALQHTSKEERIQIALFLCSVEPNKMLEQLKPQWNNQAGLSVSEKLLVINHSLFMGDIFPWQSEVSQEMEFEKFAEAFLVQPDLFLRLRPSHENSVKKKLVNAGVGFTEINSSCLALPNNLKIDTIIELDKEAVIQDYSSQQTAESLKKSELPARNSRLNTWDCCAASGGKSLLLYDTFPGIILTVSDIRESILANLKKRFGRAGIKNYHSFIADLTKPNFEYPTTSFELIICDAPCTGSGTWGRTPEQLYYFNSESIGQYSNRQKKIFSTIITHLAGGGYLLYITCSVFKKENEEIIEYSKQGFNLEIIKAELLKGYDKKADTMFVALLRKPL